MAAVGIMFSVMALIQAVGYTWGMGAGSEIARLLGKQKKREAEQTLATALAGGILSGAVMAVIFAVFREDVVRLLGPRTQVLLLLGSMEYISCSRLRSCAVPMF